MRANWNHGPIPANVLAPIEARFDRQCRHPAWQDGRLPRQRREHAEAVAKGAWTAEGRTGRWTATATYHLVHEAPDGTMLLVAYGSPGALRILAETLDAGDDGLPDATTQAREAGMNLSVIPGEWMASLPPMQLARAKATTTWQRKVGSTRRAKIVTDDRDGGVVLVSETRSAASHMDFSVVTPDEHDHALPAPAPGRFGDPHRLGVAAALRVVAAKVARTDAPYVDPLT